MRLQFKLLWATLVLGCVLPLTSSAAVPPPDQLLPADTLAVFTIPDYGNVRAERKTDPMARLWNDPALKPFREKLTTKFTTDVVEPMEREFGIRFQDYRGLVQGQVTLAITRNEWGAEPDKEPAFLLLVDARDHREMLRTNLAAFTQKWRDSGKQTKAETIRNVEFTTLVFSSDDFAQALNQVFPDPDEGYETLTPPKPKKEPTKLEWLVGQSDSLLILGNSAKAIEKVLIRQSGGTVPSLGEQAAFAQRYASDFRPSLAYIWVNLKTIVDVVQKEASAKADARPERNAGVPRGDQIMNALGLGSLTGLAMSVRGGTEGSSASIFLGAPESSRKGLTKLLAFDPKDTVPPAFVPADAVKFTRWRLDLKQVVDTLEGMVVEAVPHLAGMLKLLMDNAGKDKDPNFDLRQNLIGNLGNDLITFEKAPRSLTLQDLASPPSLIMIGSPRADQLADAVKVAAGLLPGRNLRVKDRDFLGRKVYSLDLPPSTAPGSSKPVERTVNFAASGGYVAISTDVAMLEEYLRSSTGTGKSLRSTPGLAEAADKVGGMGTGLFGFENQRETIRVALETLKNESGTLADLISGSPLGLRLGISDEEDKLKDWIDFSLLPPYERIAKYFYHSVWSGQMTADGLVFKVFSPQPPELR